MNTVRRFAAAGSVCRGKLVWVGAPWIGALLLGGVACESGPVSGSAPLERPASVTQPVAPRAPAAPPGAPPPSDTAKVADGALGRYGAALEPMPSTPLASLLSDPKAYARQTVTTEGTVQRACS